MSLEVVLDCPLDKECEHIGEDKKLHRCRWYKMVKGIDAQGGEHEEWDCAIPMNVMIGLEVATTNRGMTQAVESLRNETLLRQDAALRLIDAENTTN